MAFNADAAELTGSTTNEHSNAGPDAAEATCGVSGARTIRWHQQQIAAVASVPGIAAVSATEPHVVVVAFASPSTRSVADG